ncbi:MAG: hypothetical protein D6725_15190 [Planctomycetota bacterium]|nr:MAG: hypothetical protein D6725_15190 [Planctomycetota bacterium]
MIVSFVLVGVCIAAASVTEAAGVGQPTDWQRFYYYPYVYYPHNFRRDKPLDHLYYRYPASLRIPVYNKQWYNFYPSPKPYYRGHHFILDVF